MKTKHTWAFSAWWSCGFRFSARFGITLIRTAFFSIWAIGVLDAFWTARIYVCSTRAFSTLKIIICIKRLDYINKYRSRNLLAALASFTMKTNMKVANKSTNNLAEKKMNKNVKWFGHFWFDFLKLRRILFKKLNKFWVLHKNIWLEKLVHLLHNKFFVCITNKNNHKSYILANEKKLIENILKIHIPNDVRVGI